MTDTNYIETLNLPKELNITSVNLNNDQRNKIKKMIGDNDDNTTDYTYAHRNHAIMRVALEDMKDNSWSGCLFTMLGLIAADGAMSSMNILKGTRRFMPSPLRIPIHLAIGSVLYWSWTGNQYREYGHTAQIVNKDISLQLNRMMNLK